MKTQSYKGVLQANSLLEMLEKLCERVQDAFDEHPARNTILNKHTEELDAAFTFGVLHALSTLAVGCKRIKESDIKIFPFEASYKSAQKCYNKYLKDTEEDEEYEQITIDDLLDLLKNKKKKF